MSSKNVSEAALAGNTGGHLQPVEPARSLPNAEPPAGAGGGAPGGASPKEKTRQLMVALPPVSATLLRQISGLTKISQARLIETIEGSKDLRQAAVDVLEKVWLEWKEKQAKADPFAGLKPKE